MCIFGNSKNKVLIYEVKIKILHSMKYFFPIIFILLTIPAFSQTNAWFTDASQAKTYAMEHKVPILLVFAGSDWCKPCMMLKADILKSAEFESYFPSKMAVLYLDFPMKSKNKLSAEHQKQNELLAEKYNQSGLFPNLLFIDTNGKVLGNLTYKHQTPSVFIEQCNSILNKNK